MVQRPTGFNAFEFAVLAGLRAAQLARGSTPRVSGSHKVTMIAQQEIAEGKIVREALIVAGPAQVVAS
jgi:DNA-directed RNA polymerase subunit K/omega